MDKGVKSLTGIIFSIMAGIFISFQGVFNTRVSDKIGLWETNTIVMGTGLLVAAILMLLFGKGNFESFGEVNKLYLTGGTLGVFIVFSVMQGISLLGATYSIAIVIIVQLIMATIIDCFGLFGNPQIAFHFTKPLGVAIMIFGLIIFKLKG